MSRDATAHWRLAYQIGGTAVGAWAGLLLAVGGAMLTPLRLGGVPAPVCLVVAVAGNAGLLWFGWYTTRHRFLALVPGLVWVAVSVVASNTTADGDVLLAGNSWVALTYLVAGSVTVAVGGYRMILRDPARGGTGPARL